MSTNQAVIVIKGHAGTEQAHDFVVNALNAKSITIDKELELRAVDVLENPRITRFQRMAFSFVDTVYVFAVSWDSSEMSWKDFRLKLVGDTDANFEEPQSPANAPKGSLRSEMAEKYDELGLADHPSADNNLVYASPSPLEAIADRGEWFGQNFDEDPLVQMIGRDTENGFELLSRYVRNVYIKDVRAETANGAKEGNVYDLVEGFDTQQFIDFVAKEQMYFVDCVEQNNALGARRSTMRVTQEHPEEDEIYTDTDFMERQVDVVRWVRIGELYPPPKDGELLPSNPKIDQFIQGEQDDCTLLSAIALFCDRHPKILENIFVTKEVRKDGRYTFQFYKWDKWEKVEIDDQIPVDSDGKTILNCRSPTQHWWPLLLEKAYAKFYGSYSAIQSGNMSETLHDLTAKPVESLVLTQSFVEQGAIKDFNEPAFWNDLFEDIKAHKLVLAFPASRGDGSDDGPTREDSDELGFEPGHGYAALELREGSGGGDGIENMYIRLHNPFLELRYKDNEISEELKVTYRADGTMNDFWVPIDVLLQITQTIFICRIKGVEEHPYIKESKWQGITAGGAPNSVSWRNNPIYTVLNAGTTPVRAMVVLKQRDQRYGNPDSSQREFEYKQCGLVAVRHNDENNLIATPYICNNLFKPFHRGVYLNQREVCDAITFAPNSLSYVVPSCIAKDEESDFLLAVYLPQGTNPKTVTVQELHANVDHLYPLHREIFLSEKEKTFTDLVLRSPTEVHALLRQRKDKSSNGGPGPDLSTNIHVALTVFNEKNEKVGGMNSGLNYKENSVVIKLNAGRYSISTQHAKGSEDLEADLFVSVHPKSIGVLAPHRDFVTEVEEKEEAQAKLKADEAEKARKKAEYEAALAQKKANEEAAKKKKEEEEEARKKKEKEDAAKAEKARLEAEEAARKKKEKEEQDAKDKAEKERLAAEEAAKKKKEEEEAAQQKKAKAEQEARIKAEKERLAAEEADRKQKEKEAQDAKAKADKEEKERQAAEEADRKKKEQEEKAAKDKAEKERLAAEETERKRKEAEEASRKKKELEEQAAHEKAEKERLATEEADRKKKEKEAQDAKAKADKEAEAERKRKEKEEQDSKHKADKAERERQAAEEADRKKREKEENDARAKAEKEKAKAEKEAEKKRKAEEEAAIKAKVAAFKKATGEVNKPPPKAPLTAMSPRKITAATGNEHYLTGTKASKASATQSAGHDDKKFSDKAPRLPPIMGFGSSSPRMVSNYRILPYIQKHEEGAF